MSATLAQLFDSIPQRGRVIWLGLRAVRRAAMTTPCTMILDCANGIVGDRYAGRSRVRQVTLFQYEHLAVVRSILGRDTVDYTQLRRNIVVAGINLLALKKRHFRLGDVVLEGTGLCQPCSRMEDNLGPGGYNAMRGHGGITARVIVGGRIEIDDEVTLQRDVAGDQGDQQR